MTDTITSASASAIPRHVPPQPCRSMPQRIDGLRPKRRRNSSASAGRGLAEEALEGPGDLQHLVDRPCPFADGDHEEAARDACALRLRRDRREGEAAWRVAVRESREGDDTTVRREREDVRRLAIGDEEMSGRAERHAVEDTDLAITVERRDEQLTTRTHTGDLRAR